MNTFEKAVIIHHTDCDGLCGAKICEQGIKAINPTIKDVVFIPVAYYTKLYIKDEHKKKDTVFIIVDYSLKFDELDELLQGIDPSQIIWLDHHVSVIEEYSRHPMNNYLKGLRVPHGVCGAELAYTYFFLNGYQREYGIDEFYADDKKIETTDPKSLNLFFSMIPKGLKYVGDWDVWRWVEDPDEYGRKLNAGFYMLAPSLSDDSDFWKVFYDKTMDGSDALKAILLNGEIIVKYPDRQDKGLCRRFAFPAHLDGYGDFEIVALNSAVHNSHVFKSIEDLYEIGLIYHFTGQCFVFSIYRLAKNPEKEIDVSKIASVFGGGGHHDVAGFELKNTRSLLPRD